MKINLVAFDPALRNLGIAYMVFDTDTEKLELKKLELVQTVPAKYAKGVRKNSDDLMRAQTLHRAMMLSCKHAHLAVAEMPEGSQSSRGAMSNAMCIGVLASCPVPLIQVSPREVKMVSVGKKSATKPEMIEWAMKKYPHKDWLMRTLKQRRVPVKANEHLADACAVAEAGILTEEFAKAKVGLLLPSLLSQS